MYLHLRPTPNNFFITQLSPGGEVLRWVSAGSLGLRGPRRSTPLAAEQTARAMADLLRADQIRSVALRVVGPLGSRVRAALRGLVSGSQPPEVLELELLPPLAHNGLRPAKRRRV